ncbi:MAG: magnesium/cobalt transporter CorA [Candidatus Caenarcaniphilales bacterium]|nr:magnesium/cobalt transporter CorA [Candidatus Caenarcaniphilales bacterium]
MIQLFRPHGQAITIDPYADIDLSESSITWLHITDPGPIEYNFLYEKFRFEESAIDECLDPEHFPRYEEFENCIFMVTFYLLPSPENLFHTRELNIFAGKDFLVTISKNTFPCLKILCEKVKRGGIKSPEILLFEVLDQLNESFVRTVEKFELRLDSLEQALFKENDSLILSTVLEYKSQLRNLRRLLIPQRDVLYRISNIDHIVFSKKGRLQIRNAFDQLSYQALLVDSYLENMSSLVSVYHSQAATSMNEIIKTLTMISTIVLPLSLIVGYYGMNFRHFPELDWKMGLPAVWTLMTVLAIGLLIYFRRKKWL